MTIISFMTANYVARQLGFRMADWGEGDRATRAHFSPPETFPERFGEMLALISGMGFRAIDLWTSHLDPVQATASQIAAAKRLLAAHGLRVVSLAGCFGDSRQAVEASCRLAVALGTTVLGGSTPLVTRDRDWLIHTLRRHGLRLAIENHPERTPSEMLEKIGDGGGGTIGTTVDTGWYGTQGYDAARAIEELAPHLMHVHLKDVRRAGGHETCRLGTGVVPIEGCLQALRRIGYGGAISVEHGPNVGDPSRDIQAGAELVRAWSSG